MYDFKELNITKQYKGFTGEKISIRKLINRQITVHAFDIRDSTKKQGEKCLHMQIEVSGVKHVVFVGSKPLMDIITQIPKDRFPFTTTIVDNGWYEFT